MPKSFISLLEFKNKEFLHIIDQQMHVFEWMRNLQKIVLRHRLHNFIKYRKCPVKLCFHFYGSLGKGNILNIIG